MKFNNILFIYSEKINARHLDCIKKINELLEKYCDELKVVNASNLNKEYFKDLDLVITAGGDGIFIRASHYLEHTLILGINSESEFSEGALTSINDGELDKLKNILDGNYNILQKDRMDVKLNDIVLRKKALNEVYIGAEKQFHTSRYVINFNETKEEHRSSGVLVVTSGGRTAWHQSAGGKPFSNKGILKFLTREPFVGRIFKPKLLQGEIKDNEKIIFESTRPSGGIISLDSNKSYEFNSKDIVEIKLSDKPLNVVVPK